MKLSLKDLTNLFDNCLVEILVGKVVNGIAEDHRVDVVVRDAHVVGQVGHDFGVDQVERLQVVLLDDRGHCQRRREDGLRRHVVAALVQLRHQGLPGLLRFIGDEPHRDS